VSWRRVPQTLWRAAPGYLVLATVAGDTVEVGGAGGDIWAQLADWISEEDLAATLARQYGADQRLLSPDVRSLLEKLHAQGYVERDD
jgi:hypothetical protein